jgi:hypothetical protein
VTAILIIELAAAGSAAAETSGLPPAPGEPGDQATVYAEIREHPLGHPAILDPAQDGYHDTSTQARPART